MKHFWNERFSSEIYIYGELPNKFFRSQLSLLPKGNILLPGEGEGRNAVWAAANGWQVDAVDYSESGREKALALSAKNNVKLNDYLIEDLTFFEPKKLYYDVIALVFVHLNPVDRPVLHQKLVEALKPGGRIIIEAFTPDQLRFNSGGPRNPDLLYSAEMLAGDFAQLKINLLEESIGFLDEGDNHAGKAALVRLVAEKL
ncbi:MAG: SAM-dependent methyltransferase [Bacteroidetes bacterium HGW-Bacteroidetes-1]|jgi:SAM-dependent methyltransferase|nr:MAG: SAM-dependent methyltransferase [Bacteroidetes bacterium HGW-Bacteroidetes-1]